MDKPNREVTISLRIEPDLVERLKREAEKQDRSVSYIVRQCIIKALPDDDGPAFVHAKPPTKSQTKKSLR